MMPLEAPDRFEIGDDKHLLPTDGYAQGSHDDTNDSQVSELDPLHDDQSEIDQDEKPIWLNGKTTRKSWDKVRGPGRFGLALIALFVISLCLLLAAGGLWSSRRKQEAHNDDYGLSEPWYPTPKGGTLKEWEEAYSKAAALVKQMTLVEKVNITTGIGWSMGMCVGNTGTVDRLGFPSLCLQDGPLGLRFTGDTTVFPAGVTVGATWNKRLMHMRGKAHGFEARLKGINVILGPGVGPLGRLPAGGRNWEGFGSDPVLQGIAAAETIKGIQSEGVVATIKHWVGNEQEHFRQAWEWGISEAISSNIDDRALHEIYAWPFAEAVRADVGSIMCSYNKVNNSYACQNSKLMNGVLKDELGFQGFVQSDWLAQRSGVASALAGLDMTMPGDGLKWQDGVSVWGSELTKAVLNSSLPIERFNDMVLRVVATWYHFKQDDRSKWPDVKDGGGPNFSSWTKDDEGLLHPGSPDSSDTGVVNRHVPVRQTDKGGDHNQLARRVASEGIVLVKNDDQILPLKRDASNIRSKGDSKIKIGLFGEDGFVSADGLNKCPDQSCNNGTLTSGWGSGAAELPYLSEPAAAIKSAFNGSIVDFTEIKTNDDPNIGNLADEQDLCIVFVNSDAGEGFESWNGIDGDRNELRTQKGGDNLVQTVAGQSGCETIVVLHTVGPTILENWIELSNVKAVLIAHLPGQESGNSLADVLFGYHNPSGHLPYTIAKDEEDYGPTSKILKKLNHPTTPQQDFEEGLYIDYRYFDKHDIEPRYEFGYGLSYTRFELKDLKLNSAGLNTTLPKKREYYAVQPPKLDHHIPPPETALWPAGMRRLSKYIYPYIESVDDVNSGAYDWPDGYEAWHAPSAAGGGLGGNPDLWTTAVKVGAQLSNTGGVAGDCVVQVYISYPDRVVDKDREVVDMPVRVLRGFEKPTLEATGKDRTKLIEIELTRKDMSYWDVKIQNWVMPPGDFKICIGFSSRDLPLCQVWTNKAA